MERVLKIFRYKEATCKGKKNNETTFYQVLFIIRNTQTVGYHDRQPKVTRGTEHEDENHTLKQ